MTFVPLTIALVADTKAFYQEKFQLKDEECTELPPQVQIDTTFQAIELLGHKVQLVDGIFDLVSNLGASTPGQKPPWDLVFNIAAGMFGSAKEAQAPALLEAYNIPATFSSAAAISMCMDKALTKAKLAHYDIPVTPWVLIPHDSLEKTIIKQQSDGILVQHQHQRVLFRSLPLFIKPNSESSSLGIYVKSRIEHIEDILPAIAYLHTRHPKQDLLIEPFLGGKELSVGVLGTGDKARVLGTIHMVDNRQKVDMYQNKLNGITNGHHLHDKKANTSDCSPSPEAANFYTFDLKRDWFDCYTEEHINGPLVAEVEDLALAAHRALGLRDCSRFDIRFDHNGEGAQAYVIEVNPIPGLVPGFSTICNIAKDNGLEFEDLIASIIESARGRISR